MCVATTGHLSCFKEQPCNALEPFVRLQRSPQVVAIHEHVYILIFTCWLEVLIANTVEIHMLLLMFPLLLVQVCDFMAVMAGNKLCLYVWRAEGECVLQVISRSNSQAIDFAKPGCLPQNWSLPNQRNLRLAAHIFG